MKKGYFITFEGVDGSGKSTQIMKLKEYLEDRDCRVFLTREPGGTEIGEKIRDMILDRENFSMTSLTEAYLYAASRAQHVEKVIKPSLKKGKVVICDRFIDSSIAYQGYGRGLGDKVIQINKYAIDDCVPDLTFLLNIDIQDSGRRIDGREKDRMEMEETGFFRLVHQGYKEIEHRDFKRVVGISGRDDVETIHRKIIIHVERILSEKGENE